MMDFLTYIRALEDRLRRPLPGRRAQMRMTSLERMHRLLNGSVPEDARPSSVLVLLYPHRDGIGFPLIQRPEYPGVHSGQISLPGGKKEDTDESLIYTALRETNEEIGVDPRQVQVIGQLTELYIPPSNFLVTPVVGFIPVRPEFRPDAGEVDRIVEVTLQQLTDPSHRDRKKIRIPLGLSLSFPAYVMDGNVIWGATAMMLSELEAIIGELG